MIHNLFSTQTIVFVQFQILTKIKVSETFGSLWNDPKYFLQSTHNTKGCFHSSQVDGIKVQLHHVKDKRILSFQH